MSENRKQTALVFGGFGTIGTAICSELQKDGFDVYRTSTSPRIESNSLTVDGSADGLAALSELPTLDAVVWAHGVTGNDSIETFDNDTLHEMFEVNCVFVARTLQELLKLNRINQKARLCVVSSIWQEQARPDRLSYSMSKGAVGGLVRSVAIDLADRGIIINAVMPGVVDTPMASRPGSSAQVFSDWTPHGRVLAAREVATAVRYLCSIENTAVTGQSIAVDLGSLTSRMPTR